MEDWCILRSYLHKHDLATVYKSIVLSILNYALYIHLPLHLSEKIEKLGKRMHNIICHYCCKYHSTVRRENAINLYQKANEDPDHKLFPKINQPLCVSVRKKKLYSLNNNYSHFFPKHTILISSTIVTTYYFISAFSPFLIFVHFCFKD